MKTAKRVSGLFLRFLAMYLVVILIPTIALGSFVYKYYFHYMQDTLEKNSVSTLERIQATHDNYLVQMESILNQIYLSKSFTAFRLETSPEKALALSEELNIILQVNNFLGEMVFHFAGDSYIYTSSGTNTEKMFFEQAWTNAAVYTPDTLERLFTSAEPLVLPLHPVGGYRKSGEYAAYSYPIPLQGASPYATVIFFVPKETYEALFQSANEEFCSTYIERNGAFLVQDSNLTVSGPLLRQMQEGEYQTKYLTEDGADYLAVRVHGAYSAMTYYQIISLKEIYQPLYQAKNLFLLVNAAVLLLCGVLMFWFSRISYNPFRKLSGMLRTASAEAAPEKNELVRIMNGFSYVYEQNQKLNVKLDESKKARCQMLLLDFIKGRFGNKDSMLPLCDEAGFHIARPYFDIMLIRFSHRSALSPIDSELEEIFGVKEDEIDLYSTELLSSNTIAVVSFFDSPKAAQSCKEKLWQKLLELGFVGAAGVSEPYSDISNASKSFIEASAALTFRRVGESRMIFFSSIQDGAEHFDTYPFGLLSEFQKAVEQNQQERVERLTDELVSSMENAAFSHTILHCIRKDMLDTLVKRSIELKVDSAALYQLHRDVQADERETALSDFGERVKEICRSFSAAIQKRNLSADSGRSEQALEIIQYINEHCLSVSFSLYNAAEHFGMSPSQLSSYFKAELNLSPSAYIAGYKIRRAKFLLTKTDKSVAEICAELGYSDPSSFIRKFKQMTGTTPAAYRRDAEGRGEQDE